MKLSKVARLVPGDVFIFKNNLFTRLCIASEHVSTIGVKLTFLNCSYICAVRYRSDLEVYILASARAA